MIDKSALTDQGTESASARVHGAKLRPLVTVLITARNRPEELAKTLSLLQEQSYPAIELMVIDDASDQSLAPIVHDKWPNAKFTRNESVIGLIGGRSRGMAAATGTYLLVLDDDSSLTRSDDIERAVRRLEEEPELAVLTFRILETPTLPSILPGHGGESYAHTFSGGAHIMRVEAARMLGGYRDFYFYGGEEAEYSLRLISQGWRILWYPSVTVHHRKSPIGRQPGRIWAHSYRNSIWTILLLYPFRRVVVLAAWRAMLYSMAMVRRRKWRWGIWAIASLLRGLPKVLRERKPVSTDVVRIVDSLSVRRITRYSMTDLLRPVTWGERWRWFRHVWWNRYQRRTF